MLLVKNDLFWNAGHCNVQTDIKEAVFLGGNDEMVASGSDDGLVFIYNSASGRVVSYEIVQD